jgi:hypothetical protein
LRISFTEEAGKLYRVFTLRGAPKNRRLERHTGSKVCRISKLASVCRTRAQDEFCSHAVVTTDAVNVDPFAASVDTDRRTPPLGRGPESLMGKIAYAIS